ncbi:MAG TPA: transcriptional regulator NrdR [Candidatus Gracilibacteria bacterium]|nr:transcriptional regulator NrdR [Candidatus Gracilibacteria bacterium]
MLCPQCKHDNIKVLESRDTDNGIAVRRRRECEKCGYRFTTFERIESGNFLVIKKDETREPYDREKLKRSIWISCGKRPVSQSLIDETINELEQKWQSEGKEIASAMIGNDVMDKLKNIDEIAYIRFASVYRNFKDLETFKNELISFLHQS